MKFFLLLIILAMGGAGYYEYRLLQQGNATYEQRLSDLQAKLDKTEAENKSQLGEMEKLAKEFADAQAKIKDLNSQLEAAAKATETSTAVAKTSASTASTPAETPRLASSNPNELGTILTVDGKKFDNCKLLHVEMDGITFSHASGITKVMFPLLPADLQKQYGFDPTKGTQITADQALALEKARFAAAQKAISATTTTSTTATTATPAKK